MAAPNHTGSHPAIIANMLTTHEAAQQLKMSYWHFMHLVESGKISGVRVIDRWLFFPHELDAYRKKKFGRLEEMARLALQNPQIELTEKQTQICHYLLQYQRPAQIARHFQQSRQAIHAQIALIREKVESLKIAPSDP